MAEAEQPERLRRPVTVDDVRQLMGSSTPHFALQIRDRIRRLIAGNGKSVDVALSQGETRWLDAQTHSGENIGDTPTHVLFVELKGSAGTTPGGSLGPS